MRRSFFVVGSLGLIVVFAMASIAFGQGSVPKAAEKAAFVKKHVLVFAMQADLMEAIQEAFAYQLLNQSKERDEFFAKIKDFDSLAGKLKPLIKDKALLGDLGKLVEAKNAMVKAAEDMFKKYAANNKPDAAAVKAFEAKVDALTKLYDKVEDDLGKKAEKAGVLTSQFAETGWHVHRAHADVFEAVEEAMAYPLIGDEAEKKDFFKKMKDFDDIAKHLANDPDHLKYDKPKLELLKKVIAFKGKLQTAAETMFKDYKTKKALVPDDVMKFETVVDEMTAACEKLSGALLKDVTK